MTCTFAPDGSIIPGMGQLRVSVDWLAALAAWQTYLRAASRPETTIYLRNYHMRRFAAEHPGRGPWSFTLDDLLAWLGSHPWGVETRRSYRATLRSFYAWAVLAGHLAASPAALLPPIKPTRGRPRPAADRIIEAALAGAPPRERLMIMLGAYAGMRRCEICRAHTNDLVEGLDGWSLRIVGKGGHVRVVPLSPPLTAALRDQPAGWLFPNEHGGHLSKEHVGKMVSRQLPAGWAAHTLRHRFATTMRARGVQLDVIRELLGHSRVETTLIYSQVPGGDLRDAVTLAAA